MCHTRAFTGADNLACCRPKAEIPRRELGSLKQSLRTEVTVALAWIEQGTLSAFKRVGAGGLEYRIDFGPGYRVYFGLDGDTLVILLGGGTKKRQQRDIETARLRWGDYKQRKRQRGRSWR